MTQKTPITIARGDGIGPQIMDAVLKIMDKAGAQLEIHEIEIGEKMYEQGLSSGIKPEAWDTLRKTGVFLKAPITTPMGGGFKSLNVTVRKSMGLFANVRPCVAYSPYVKTHFPNMDMVIIRENEEDLYAGIEYRHTQDAYEAMKLISRPGSERICRYAFEYARTNGRKKVTCMVKDNIMKMSDGMFYKVFEEVAKDYPEIENDRWIIDIGAARIAARPEDFDVVVTLNLYGDIISDIAAEVTGSVGLGGSSNVGEHCAMFEAIHGSAPRMAPDTANPSGLLLGALMMLNHIGQQSVAEKIHNAWLRTLEDGIHTKDIYREDLSQKKVGTTEFADAVIARLGQMPQTMKPISYPSGEDTKIKMVPPKAATPQTKALVGTDVYLDWKNGTPEQLAEKLLDVAEELKLTLITNRGVMVWPGGQPETFCTDHWRCRFFAEESGMTTIMPAQIIMLLARINGAGLDFIKAENLYRYNGEPGYSAGQGE